MSEARRRPEKVIGHFEFEASFEDVTLGWTDKEKQHLRDGDEEAKDEAAQAMGIDWMTRDEMTQAIPPAYTEHIGHFLMREIEARAEAVA